MSFLQYQHYYFDSFNQTFTYVEPRMEPTG